MPPSKFARIISLNSQKGGVGKTTSAIHLSKGLALGGYRTLLMDIDPQGSVQSALRVERQSRAGSYELFCVPGTRLEDVCQPSGSQNLDLVLANARELREEHEINRVAGDYYFLSQWIDEHALDHYDFIILDSPATTGVLSINVMLAANLIVVPLQCQALAVKSLKRFLGAFRDLQKNINPSTPGDLYGIGTKTAMLGGDDLGSKLGIAIGSGMVGGATFLKNKIQDAAENLRKINEKKFLKPFIE